MATIEELVQLAEELLSVEFRITEAEENLAEAKRHYRRLAENEIPEMMDEIGIETFRLKNGRSIEINSTYVASIKKEDRPRAFAWLRSHGFGSLIKRKVGAEFGKGEDEKAEHLLEELSSRNLYTYDDASVHHNTLRAFVREQISMGSDIPHDLFGIHEIRQVTIK